LRSGRAARPHAPPQHGARTWPRAARTCQLDVADENLVIQFAAQVTAAGDIDVLINAAGTDARALGADAGQRGPFEISASHFLAEIQVNAAGPMLVTQALLPQLINGTPGKVVNLSSRLASMAIGTEICWDIGYNASKAALNAITVRTARLLASQQVIVVAIHPGWVRTDMGGPQASLDPDDAARQLAGTIAGLGPQHSGMFLPRTARLIPGDATGFPAPGLHQLHPDHPGPRPACRHRSPASLPCEQPIRITIYSCRS
jgi:NAD(P)-dependent dehydrogenase (short-subunit alcohol dehydrogenase family)